MANPLWCSGCGSFWESVTHQTRDYCDQKIEEINPNEVACQPEENILVYKYDSQELNCWQEKSEKLKTIPKSWKTKLLQALGDVEQHGESFPVLPTVPENATALAPGGPVDEVAGQDEDNVGPEEADLEPDKDDSDYEEPAASFEPTKAQKADLQIAHENSGHPSAKDFARMLRRGNCKPEIANWVAKNFKCPECEANKRPKSRRPTAVPKTYRFHHVVGIDLVDVK